MNISKMIQWFRDKKRGYTDADMDRMLDKFAKHKPKAGSWVHLTGPEYKAFMDTTPDWIMNGVEHHEQHHV